MKNLYIFSLTLIFMQLFSQNHEEAERKSMIKAEQSRYARMIDFNVNPNTLNYDLRYQRLELNLDPAVRYVSGTVTSHFVPSTELNSIYFDLSDVLTVSEVKHRGVSLPFTQLGTKEVKIDFTAALPAGQIDSLSIKYAGVPDNSGSAGDAFTVSTQGGTPTLYTLSEPYGAQEWFPTKQSLNDKIEKVDVIVSTPTLYSVASNGLLLSEKIVTGKKVTFWQTKYPIPAYLIALGITNYTKINDTMGTPAFPFVNYLYPATANNSTVRANIEWTKAAMNLFEEYFGPYPYRDEKYGHMEFSWGGGMEHSTMSSMGSWGKGIIAHELAHQWFGDKVTCGAWNDVWINEGFAAYGEHLVNEKLLMSEPQFMSYLQSEMNYITSNGGGSVYVSDSNLNNINVIFSGRLSYSKGAYVLRMLKWVVGEDAFYNALKEYHARPALAYNYAKTADFAASVQQSTGMDLTGFFNDWIYGQGYPTYRLKWNQTADQMLRINVTQIQSHSSVNFFEMPLPVKVNGTSGEVAYLRLDNTVNNQNFANLISFPVASIEFNYKNQILQRNSTVIKDGSILAVTDASKKEIQLYPNPVKTELSISGATDGDIFEIYSADGKLLRTGTYNRVSKINVSALPKGLYHLRISGVSLKFLRD